MSHRMRKKNGEGEAGRWFVGSQLAFQGPESRPPHVRGQVHPLPTDLWPSSPPGASPQQGWEGRCPRACCLCSSAELLPVPGTHQKVFPIPPCPLCIPLLCCLLHLQPFPWPCFKRSSPTQMGHFLSSIRNYMTSSVRRSQPSSEPQEYVPCSPCAILRTSYFTLVGRVCISLFRAESLFPSVFIWP